MTEKLVSLKPVGEAMVIGDLHGDLSSLESIFAVSSFLDKMDSIRERESGFPG